MKTKKMIISVGLAIVFALMASNAYAVMLDKEKGKDSAPSGAAAYLALPYAPDKGVKAEDESKKPTYR